MRSVQYCGNLGNQNSSRCVSISSVVSLKLVGYMTVSHFFTQSHFTLYTIDRLKQEYTQLQQAQAEAIRVLEEKIEDLGTQFSSTTVVREREVNHPVPLTAPEVTLRKDFRIWGQIGESRQKDKLSFTSLTNQIESGLKKGYSVTEIIEPVIKAVSPGLHLGDLLKIK